LNKTAIVNIGKIVSGDFNKGILDGKNAIIIVNGKIAEIGSEKNIDLRGIDEEIDANGMVVIPGLIDSHTHPAIGDWSPRFRTVGYMSEVLYGGVTTAISQGEFHVQGRPTDPSGIKALAILAKKTFDNFRPGGVRVYGGALILDATLSERDFKDLKEAGVWLTAEIGATPIAGIDELVPTVQLARKYGMKIMMHFGGKSVAGSATITTDDILRIKPDVVSHVNGGPTAPSLNDVKQLIMKTRMTLEVVYGGNLKVAVETIELAKANNALDRIIVGSDSPTTASGLGASAIMRSIVLISSLAGIPAWRAITLATGNTAHTFGLNEGRIEKGCTANLLIIDSPEGAVGEDALASVESGDLPGIAMIMTDGKVHDLPKLIPPPRRSASRVTNRGN
jgi:enamidase